jgi:hypothetical protein
MPKDAGHQGRQRQHRGHDGERVQMPVAPRFHLEPDLLKQPAAFTQFDDTVFEPVEHGPC